MHGWCSPGEWRTNVPWLSWSGPCSVEGVVVFFASCYLQEVLRVNEILELSWVELYFLINGAGGARAGRPAEDHWFFLIWDGRAEDVRVPEGLVEPEQG